MTRTEAKLFDGAERLWPGSGDDLVLVYRCYHMDGVATRGDSLWAAVTISALLQGTKEDRSRCLAELADRLPTSNRNGPKRARSLAASAALARLVARCS